MQKLKKSHEHWHLQAFISIAMYPVICRNDDQAISDLNEQSEKKTLSFMKLLRPVPSQGIVEQAKKNGCFRFEQADRGLTKMACCHFG